MAETTPTCNGVCIHASELGVDDVFTGIAYPHPDCPLHGAPQERRCSDPIECGHEVALGQARAEVERLTAITDRDARKCEEYGKETAVLTVQRDAALDARDRADRAAVQLGRSLDNAEEVMRQALATWQNGSGNAEAAMQIIADHVAAVDGA